eukprot:CAMPEP_0197045138 /NCGR_PEP_ID=MMETSP1384-20130603/21063_1 /TAXON_ID=29189 /ORGANISM="Ammonia sp." /LENGTH=176 /DNA_ID=CAMNT_0042476705 /DNA_START=24 /DNA_END=554 /DNA_ORIENTATION=-
MTEFRHSLDALLKKHEHTTGFAVIEESGLRIGANGSLKNANIMILNDIFSAARNVIDFTNELFNVELATMVSKDTATHNAVQTDVATNGDYEAEQNEGGFDDEEEDMHEEEEEEEEDDEEEEFKLIIETKNQQRLVLCTVEGVSCAMMQTPPYHNNNHSNAQQKSSSTDNEEKTEN